MHFQYIMTSMTHSQSKGYKFWKRMRGIRQNLKGRKRRRKWCNYIYPPKIKDTFLSGTQLEKHKPCTMWATGNSCSITWVPFWVILPLHLCCLSWLYSIPFQQISWTTCILFTYRVLGSPVQLKLYLHSWKHKLLRISNHQIQSHIILSKYNSPLESWCKSPWSHKFCHLYSWKMTTGSTTGSRCSLALLKHSCKCLWFLAIIHYGLSLATFHSEISWAIVHISIGILAFFTPEWSIKPHLYHCRIFNSKLFFTSAHKPIIKVHKKNIVRYIIKTPPRLGASFWY